MTIPSEQNIAEIRTSARQLVRELGFMKSTLAGTGLSASGVHALIEIANGRELTARELAGILLLEKSTISRLLKRLVGKGLVAETPARHDARRKHLALTPQGYAAFREITAMAERQVIDALAPLPARTHDAIASGLRHYADALGQSRRTAAEAQPQLVQFGEGYTPGIVGRIAEMHAQYYARRSGFGTKFESRVAGDLAEFVLRLPSPQNLLLSARAHGRIVGSIAIDGQDLSSGAAHLRWYIVDDTMRGAGVGAALLERALAFCDAHSFDEVHLWTFSGLDAARWLYEKNGFALTEEHPGDQWGREVLEQRFVRRHPGNARSMAGH